jgi:hypothetical protein
MASSAIKNVATKESHAPTKQILLDNRPGRGHVASNFKLVTTDTRAAGRPGAGAPPLPEPGPLHARPHERRQELRPAAAAGRGDASAAPWARWSSRRNPKFAVGDKVVGMGGWQEYSVVDANSPARCARWTPPTCRCRHYLGAVGMPGVTAWYGLVKIIAPKAGDTVVVSAATGAVGSAFARWPRRAAAAWWALPAGRTSASLRRGRTGL